MVKWYSKYKGILDQYHTDHKNNQALDVVQTGIDVAGLVPAIGVFADGTNVVIYLARRDYENALLSGVMLIPFEDCVALGGKLVNKSVKANKSVRILAEVSEDVAKRLLKDQSKLNDAARVAKESLDDKETSSIVKRLTEAKPVVKANAAEVKQLKELVDDGKFQIDLQLFAEGAAKVIKDVKVKFNGKEVPVYRGGEIFKVRPDKDIRIDKNTGLVRDTHGISLDVDPNNVSQFGGAYKIEAIPEGLKIIQRGTRLEHFEIVPSKPMTLNEYQDLLNQIVVTLVK